MRGDRIGKGYESAYKIEGLDRLSADLSGLPKELAEGILRDAIKEAFEPALKAAKRRCPVGQGGGDHLRDTIHLVVRKARDGTFAAFVNCGIPGPGKRTGDFVGDQFYAGMVEFGTVKQAAQPFMRPAFDETKNEVVEKLESIVYVGLVDALSE